MYMYLSPVGEGVHKLVSMIRAQHQAWSERLAARASLLQSTISQMEEDTAPTPLFPTPPGQQSEAGGTHNSYPAPPTHEHDQEAERALHTHPSLSADQGGSGTLHQTHEHIQEESSAAHTYPRLSLHQHFDPSPSPPSHTQIQDDDRALNQHQHRVPLSHDQVGSGAKLNYPLSQNGERVLNMPPSLSYHDQSGTGVNENGSTVMPSKTSTSHHDSLSIFTLSTRYGDSPLSTCALCIAQCM